jgi:hypothetical protein
MQLTLRPGQLSLQILKIGFRHGKERHQKVQVVAVVAVVEKVDLLMPNPKEKPDSLLIWPEMLQALKPMLQ